MKNETLQQMKRKLYSALASVVDARLNCIATKNDEWRARHTETLETLCETSLPRGSGFDCGTKIDLVASSAEKLVLTTEFHHMNENGMYDGWTSHRIIVTPSLAHGFTLLVTGKDRNQTKEYISDVFHHDLDCDV